LAAGIARVKGVKQLGQRSGNWLTQDQSADVLRRARGESLRAKRDYAMLAMLFGCGLRRSELAGLEMDDIQTNAAGTLGHCRFNRQGRSCPYGSDSALGQTGTR
jgi:site-specific recombinase XerD